MRQVKEILLCLTIATALTACAEETEPPAKKPVVVASINLGNVALAAGKEEANIITPIPAQETNAEELGEIYLQEEAERRESDRLAWEEDILYKKEIAKAERQRKNDEAVMAMSLVWNLGEGGLTETATEALLERAEAKIENVTSDYLEDTLLGMAEAAQAEFDRIAAEEKEAKEKAEREANKKYFGNCRITHYCSCSSCSGSYGAVTASGESCVAGWTVANGSLPFGTRVLINGHEYCVTDRGVGGDQFDIYVNSHSEALERGLYYTDVYILG